MHHFDYLFHTIKNFNPHLYLILAAVFILLLFIGFLCVKKAKVSTGKMLLQVVFLSYILWVILGTFLSRTAGQAFRIRVDFLSNYTAFFAGDFNVQVETIANVLLFVPLGALLPLLCNTHLSLKKSLIITALGVVCFTLTIELLQFLTGCGLFETADIINNLTGAFLGITLFLAGRHLNMVLKEKLNAKKDCNQNT